MAQKNAVRTSPAPETDTGRGPTVNDKSQLVAGQTAISGTAPGMENRGDIDLGELGKLSELPDPALLDNPEEGTGEYVVVLADYLSGAGEDSFLKGHVRRLSRIIPDFADPNVDRNIIKGRVKRLFDVKAIRQATREEQGQDKVEVDFANESDSTQRERTQRINLEKENEILRAALDRATGGQANATPGQAGASEQAQDAASAEGEGKKEGEGEGEGEGDKEPTWED